MSAAAKDSGAFLPAPVVLEGAASGPLKGLTFAAKDLYDVRPCLWSLPLGLKLCSLATVCQVHPQAQRFAYCSDERRWRDMLLASATLSGQRPMLRPLPQLLLSRSAPSFKVVAGMCSDLASKLPLCLLTRQLCCTGAAGCGGAAGREDEHGRAGLHQCLRVGKRAKHLSNAHPMLAPCSA